ncbi:hypothetical protein TcCL_Unassigned04489 [Trypanosoma cruzi]|nr:hypothetical protein TcCL_Unassigned04489 [Trypanosoma cruzi]
MCVGQEMQCNCRGAALPGCGGEWGPDTERSPRHRGATHCGRTRPEGPHGVLERPSLCTQPQLMAAWRKLLCSGDDVHTKIEVSINRTAEQAHGVGLDAWLPTTQTMVGRVLVRPSA